MGTANQQAGGVRLEEDAGSAISKGAQLRREMAMDDGIWGVAAGMPRIAALIPDDKTPRVLS